MFKLIYTYFSVSILSLIGFYALLWWCVENFESIVQIVLSICQKYCSLKRDSLKEQFGEWAGNLIKYFFRITKFKEKIQFS